MPYCRCVSLCVCVILWSKTNSLQEGHMLCNITPFIFHPLYVSEFKRQYNYLRRPWEHSWRLLAGSYGGLVPKSIAKLLTLLRPSHICNSWQRFQEIPGLHLAVGHICLIPHLRDSRFTALVSCPTPRLLASAIVREQKNNSRCNIHHSMREGFRLWRMITIVTERLDIVHCLALEVGFASVFRRNGEREESILGSPLRGVSLHPYSSRLEQNHQTSSSLFYATPEEEGRFSLQNIVGVHSLRRRSCPKF
jgi:hypothetical protein